MSDLNDLNPEQRRAVETSEGPVLILAGAGTGKTRVITSRIAHLIKRGVPPNRILGVTFTNKAAREMQHRVLALLPRAQSRPKQETAERPTICTFHSLGVRILRQHIERLGYKRNFVIYDESDQIAAVKKVLSRFAGGEAKADPRLVLALLSRIKNGGARSANFGDSELAALAEHIRSRYQTDLRLCNAVDFDDLILLALRLFQEHADVLAAWRAQYRYVMVDEYQDTNAAQFQLVHLLTQEHRNFCVVGDDDQSIYGWRGAEIANLLEIERFFPEVKLIKLEQNYRSTSVILNAANALIKNNPRRRGKRLWSGNGPGEKITLHTFATDEEEARTIVEQIEFLRQIERIPWSEQAVLFRTNIQSRPLETALRMAGVRYHLIGGQSFFDRREIKDFLAYLKLFLNPHDDVSLLRVANVPPRGLSDATLEHLLAHSQERRTSVFAAMADAAAQEKLNTRACSSVRAFVEFIERTRKRLNADPQTALSVWANHFLDEIGYYDELRRSETEAEAADNRVRNVKDLLPTLDSTPAGLLPAERIQLFLEELTLDQERDEKPPEGEALTLITLHSCKGLEFPHVYIVGLEEDILPHTRSKEEGTLDEERRLFYVGITRAMRTLTLSFCRARKKYGQEIECHPSRFLAELPDDLVEPASVKGKRPVTVASGKTFFDNLRTTVG